VTKLFLHIGTHKTGTTAIQQALKQEYLTLLDEHIVWLNPPTCFRALQFARKERQGVIENCREYLHKRVNKYPEHTLVMSFEGFSGDIMQGYRNAPIIAKSLKKITADFDVSVILYLRDREQFVNSAYVQYIMQGQSWSFGQFLKRVGGNAFDWAKLTDAYRKNFGQVIVKKYEHARLNKVGGIVKEFATIIGSKTLVDVKSKIHNPSYNQQAVEIALLCNQYLPAKQIKRFRALLQKALPKRPHNKFFFDK